MKFKKGQSFKCIKDFISGDNIVYYISGKEYICELDNCLTDEKGDVYHDMSFDIHINNKTEIEYFKDYFEEIKK